MPPTELAGRHLVTIIIARGVAGIKPNLPGARRGVSMDAVGAGLVQVEVLSRRQMHRVKVGCNVTLQSASFCTDA